MCGEGKINIKADTRGPDGRFPSSRLVIVFRIQLSVLTHTLGYSDIRWRVWSLREGEGSDGDYLCADGDGGFGRWCPSRGA
jgi:hypothetical protein